MIYDPVVPFRICTQCGQEFAATRTNFHRSKTGKYRLKALCRGCDSANNHAEYVKNPDQAKLRSRRWELAHPERKNARARARYASHKSEESERKRRFRISHPEVIKERGQRYREKNSDKIREDHQRYAKENPEKVAEKNRRWKQNRKDLVNAATQRRRARRRQLPDTFTITDWRRSLEYFGGCCAACGRPPGLFHRLAMDHWIPLASPDCPGTIPANIIPLCHSLKGDTDDCNTNKSHRDATEWLISRFGKRKAKVILARIQAYFDSLKEDRD